MIALLSHLLGASMSHSPCLCVGGLPSREERGCRCPFSKTDGDRSKPSPKAPIVRMDASPRGRGLTRVTGW